MTKPTKTDEHEKVYFLIKRKALDLYITNRPNKNIEEIEYTDNKNNARRFDEDDFEILDIDETVHEKIEVIKKYAISTFESVVPFK
ncbi:DUF2483 family protein [Staphylococcus cohnii]|uniref:DUF2483 family protein n=1 Tax=Staphylococcus cohnii TaxID=29382 RepID=UPI003CE7B731